MAADHVSIAEAVKDSLNTATGLALPITATRTYQWLEALEDTDDGRIDVVVMPQSDVAEQVTRRPAWGHTFGVQVGFRAKVRVEASQHDRAQIDRYMLVIEGIKDHLRDAGKMGSATLVGIEHEPIFDPDELQELHVFMTAPVFSYRRGRTA